MKRREILAKLTGMMLAAAMVMTMAPLTAFADEAGEWREEDGSLYWYENGVKQGTEGRGKEIYDPASDAWYWLDANQGGAKAVSKDVYQESNGGKWVRYDANGHMIKGWDTNDDGTYYFDQVYGTMAKGIVTIDGNLYLFDVDTGVMQASITTSEEAMADRVIELVNQERTSRGLQPQDEAAMVGYLYLFIAALMKETIAGKPHSTSSSSQYVLNAIKYIQFNYSHDISIDDVAKSVGVSRSHLYRVFMLNVGKSPIDYLTEYRINEACKLLRAGHLSIAEVAVSVLRFLYQVLCSEEEMEVSVHYLMESGNKWKFIQNAMACLKDCADAHYIFLCEGSRVISCIEPREETVITQLWHGCGAFKKFGFSTCEELFGGSREEYLKYNYYKNYNYITVSSPEVIWAYQEAMNLPKEDKSVVPIGVSCTDLLFQEKFQKAAQKKLHDIEEKEVYLSAKGRETVRFWQGKNA